MERHQRRVSKITNDGEEQLMPSATASTNQQKRTRATPTPTPTPAKPPTSASYVAMWQRLEMVERLLYQQQETIAHLMRDGAASALPPLITNGPTPSKKAATMVVAASSREDQGTEADDDDDDEEFAARVAAQLRSIETSAGGGRRKSHAMMMSADEAFYRSLNSAHSHEMSDIDDMQMIETEEEMSVGTEEPDVEQELQMIWQQQSIPPPPSSSSHCANNFNVFSSLDYMHYRRPSRDNSQSPHPVLMTQYSEGSSVVVGTRRHQQLQQRHSHSLETVPVYQRTSFNSSASAESADDSILHQQLRLAFLESARQKSANRLRQQSATIVAPPPPPSLPAAVHIDPLLLGRSNSTEENCISPSFSSYRRHQPPPPPILKLDGVVDPFCSLSSPPNNKPTTTTTTTSTTTRSPSGGRNGSSGGSRKSPNRRSSYLASGGGARSDSGVSSLSGNWSSLDRQETVALANSSSRSPLISPGVGLQSSLNPVTSTSSLNVVDVTLMMNDEDDDDEALLPPPPAPSEPLVSRRSVVQQQEPTTTLTDRVHPPPPPAPPSSQQRHFSALQTETTETTWNIYGSIPTASVGGRHHQLGHKMRQETMYDEFVFQQPQQQETTTSNEWYSPRDVVHHEEIGDNEIEEERYRQRNSCTPSPAPGPGSVPHKSQFVPEPANSNGPTYHHQHSVVQQQQQQASMGVGGGGSGSLRIKKKRIHSSPSQLESTTPTTTSESFGLDYYDLFYQSPPPPMPPLPRHSNEILCENQQEDEDEDDDEYFLASSGCNFSQEEEGEEEEDVDCYLYRNPLAESMPSVHHRYIEQQQNEEFIGGNVITAGTRWQGMNESANVIVSRDGYISIVSGGGGGGGPPTSLPLPSHNYSAGGGVKNKKTGSKIRQFLPNFALAGALSKGKRSVSLSGVDEMDDDDDQNQDFMHPASISAANRQRASRGGGGNKAKRLFSRASSLPGLKKKGKKMIRQLSNFVGLGSGGGGIGQSGLMHAPTDGRRTFVSYCNEGFDLEGGGGVEGPPPSSSSSPLPPSTTTATSSSGGGEFAASRAVGRYRRLQQQQQQQQQHQQDTATSNYFLPDVTVVSAAPVPSQPQPPSLQIIDRTASVSDDDAASLSFSLKLDLMANSFKQQQEKEQEGARGEKEACDADAGDLFPRMAFKASPKRQQSVHVQIETAPPLIPAIPTGAVAHVQQHQEEEIKEEEEAASSSAIPPTSMRTRPTAPRWQSTEEESIDQDDEWYRYGMMQLEDMERRATNDLITQTARQFNESMDAAAAAAGGGGGIGQGREVGGGPEDAMAFWPPSTFCIVATENDDKDDDFSININSVNQEEEEEEWASYPSCPPTNVQVTSPPPFPQEQEEDEDESEFSSGDTSGPDTPLNQSFDAGEDEPSTTTAIKPPPPIDVVAIATERGEKDAPSVTVSSTTTTTPTMSSMSATTTERTQRGLISGGGVGVAGGSSLNIFQSVGIGVGGSSFSLSAAGNTASNFASSVFSFFSPSTPVGGVSGVVHQQLTSSSTSTSLINKTTGSSPPSVVIEPSPSSIVHQDQDHDQQDQHPPSTSASVASELLNQQFDSKDVEGG